MLTRKNIVNFVLSICIAFSVWVMAGNFALAYSSDVDALINYANAQGGKKASDYGFSSPWCAWFVEWCGAEVGLDKKGIFPCRNSYGGVTGLCNWFIDNDKGVAYYAFKGSIHTDKNAVSINRGTFEPQKGDLICFYWNGTTDNLYDHVGIVTGYSNGTVYFTHGNSGSTGSWSTNYVKVNTAFSRTDSQIAAYIRPNYFNDPQGYIDTLAGGEGKVWVGGWAFDKDDANASLDIHVYVGGPAMSEGAEGFRLQANHSRPDVNDAYPGVGNYHGFDECLSVNHRGETDVYVYAINIGEGENVLLGKKTVKITSPNAIYFEKSSYDVYAYESTDIQFDFEGEGIKKLRYSIEDTDICSCSWGQTNWGDNPPNSNLTVTGKKAGKTKVTILFLDEDENSFYEKSFDVVVKARQGTLTASPTSISLDMINNQTAEIVLDYSQSGHSSRWEYEIDTAVADLTDAQYDNDNRRINITVTAVNPGSTTAKFYIFDKYDNKIASTTVNVYVKQLPLTGEVNIAGTFKYGQTLTANLSNSNNTGALSYQWKRGSSIISGATGKTYTLTVNDIGYYISCEVKSSVQTGTISGTTASVITKEDGPAAPSGYTVTKPTKAGEADGKITLQSSNTYQYATNSSYNSASKVTGTQIIGLRAGTYYVRIAETNTRKPGATTTITVPDGVADLTGTVTINGTLKYGQTLVAAVSNTNNTGDLYYQWLRAGSAISGATAKTYTTVKADIGKKLSCVVTSNVETGSISGMTSSTVNKADGPAAPEGISATAPSAKGKADGKISGVTSAMEYAANESFSNKTACTGTEITGLAAGTYYVRYAETATHKASVATPVTVPEGKVALDASAPKLNSATVSNGIVIFTWTANEGVEKYAVFRKVDSGSWSKIGEASGTSYADPTVAEGHTYSYTARGMNAAGKYVTSYDTTGKSVTISVAVDTSSPVVLSATSGANGVTVTWKANAGVAKYTVFRKTDSGKWVKISEVSGTSYVDGTAVEGHTYSYTVRGMNAAGKYVTSYDTVGKSVTLSAALDKSSPVVTEVTSGAYGVIITWKANNGVTKYAVFRKTDSGKWTKIGEASGTSYLDSAVTDGTYSYTVRGMDASGKYVTSYDTTGKSVTVGGNQQEDLNASSPVLGSATAGANGITFTWTANSGVYKYAIFRKEVGGKYTKLVETTGSGTEGVKAAARSTCTYVDGTAVAGKTYVYTARGMDENGKYVTSYDTNGVTVTMTNSQAEEALDKSSPVLGSATAGANGITVTWTANSGVYKYAVFRKEAGGKWAKVAETTGSGTEGVKAVAGSACSYVDGTVVAGTTYLYTVRGMDESGKYVTSYNTNGVSATAQ